MRKLHFIIPVLLSVLTFEIIYPKSIITSKATESKTVYLTFDDGPSAITNEILNVLSHYKIKATFFVIGKNVEKHPDILTRIFKDGHAVGVHSYTHIYKEIYKDEQSLTNDINSCICAIKTVNDRFIPRLYRFPGGSFNLKDETKRVPSKLGLKHFDWNASCGDCELKTSNYMDLVGFATATAGKKNNIILLLHDAPNKTFTPKALPEIIEYFKNKKLFCFFFVGTKSKK